MSPTFLRHVRIWTVPLFMCVVASIHYYQWRTCDRSSWGTGAGFGMFATVDYHGSRFLRCYANVDGQELPIQLNRSLYKKSLAVRVLPSQTNLEQYATLLCSQYWQIENDDSKGPYLVPQTESNSGDSASLSVDRELRIEVWGMDLVAQRGQLAGKMLSHWQSSRTKSGGQR